MRDQKVFFHEKCVEKNSVVKIVSIYHYRASANLGFGDFGSFGAQGNVNLPSYGQDNSLLTTILIGVGLITLFNTIVTVAVSWYFFFCQSVFSWNHLISRKICQGALLNFCMHFINSFDEIFNFRSLFLLLMTLKRLLLRPENVVKDNWIQSRITLWAESKPLPPNINKPFTQQFFQSQSPQGYFLRQTNWSPNKKKKY